MCLWPLTRNVYFSCWGHVIDIRETLWTPWAHLPHFFLLCLSLSRSIWGSPSSSVLHAKEQDPSRRSHQVGSLSFFLAFLSVSLLFSASLLAVLQRCCVIVCSALAHKVSENLTGWYGQYRHFHIPLCFYISSFFFSFCQHLSLSCEFLWWCIACAFSCCFWESVYLLTSMLDTLKQMCIMCCHVILCPCVCRSG